MADIYRKSALDKLSSPDQLDRSIRIISPSFWIAAVGGIAIILVALIWSIFGRMPVNVMANGMYLGGDGIHSVAAENTGVVTKVYVREGDRLSKGDRVVKLDTRELKKELNALNERFDNVANITFWSTNDLATTDSKAMVDIKSQKTVTDASLNANRALLAEQKKERKRARKNMKKARKAMKKRKAAMEAAEEDYQEAVQSRNQVKVARAQEKLQVRQQKYQEAATIYNSTVQSYEASRNAVDQVKAQVKADSTNTANQDAALEMQFDSAKDAALDAIRQEQAAVKKQIKASTLTSRIEGKVIGVKVEEGGQVSAGSALCIVADDAESVVRCFVPVGDGRKIRKGMAAMVYPSTVKRQEYGHIEGKVTEVSEYVTSAEELMNLLGDEVLVSSFQQTGPVVTVTVELTKDSETVSGYKWSSRKGADVAISDGTLVSADIITEEKAPITMLIPFLKEQLTPSRENMSMLSQSAGSQSAQSQDSTQN